MQQIIMKENEAGQRFDKYLVKYLSAAPSSFIYKMLRKKNILLNDTKAQGREMLKKGDVVTFYLADDTLQKFTTNAEQNNTDQYALAYRTFGSIPIVYENEHILILNKPSGILSQKASDTDLSLNEWLIGYLLNEKKLTKEDLCTFRPSVCNRLDRNTSGLVICGKSLLGSQKMSELLKSRNIHKFYRLFVKGTMDQEALIEGVLQKNHKTNKVFIERTNSGVGDKHSIQSKSKTNSDKKEYIVTKYKPLKTGTQYSYLEVELITGKTHQIRAHLASIGHPLIGDFKYGDPAFNSCFKHLGITDQMLHSYRIEFPELQGEFLSISKKVIIAEEPALYKKLYEEIG